MVRHDTTDNRVNIKHNILFYVGVFTDVDQEGGSFVCEQYTLYELVKGLCRKCECGFVGRTVSQLKQVLYIEVILIIYTSIKCISQ